MCDPPYANARARCSVSASAPGNRFRSAGTIDSSHERSTTAWCTRTENPHDGRGTVRSNPTMNAKRTLASIDPGEQQGRYPPQWRARTGRPRARCCERGLSEASAVDLSCTPLHWRPPGTEDYGGIPLARDGACGEEACAPAISAAEEPWLVGPH